MTEEVLLHISFWIQIFAIGIAWTITEIQASRARKKEKKRIQEIINK